MLRLPLSSTLFPYTTLFRSLWAFRVAFIAIPFAFLAVLLRVRLARASVAELVVELEEARPPRSEEHTSELQSLRHLVCRLLLEKKNKKNKLTKREKHTTSNK